MTNKESGAVVIGTGMSILTLGAVLLFDRALVIAGHLLMLVGFTMLFRSKTFILFHPSRLQGTSLFVLGIVLLLCKYSLFGFLLESIGLLLIFKASMPSFKSLLLKILWRRGG